MYFFIILCLYLQVCIEFFFGVFGLVLVLQCLHLHARCPPPRHPPQTPPRVPWRRFSTVRPSCGNNSVCATDLARKHTLDFDVQFGRRSEVVVEAVDL